METSRNLPYIAVFQDIRKAMGITIYEYMVVATIYELQNNPNSKHKGWYYGNRRYLAEYLDISERNVYNCLDRMEELGLVKRDKETKFIQATGLWFDIVIMQDLKLARILRRDTASNAVENCIECSPDTARNAVNNTIDNTNDNTILSDTAVPDPQEQPELFNQTESLPIVPHPPITTNPASSTVEEKGGDYITELCEIYAEVHEKYKHISYSVRGKDRRAMGQLLAWYKARTKDNKRDKEQTKAELRIFFEACHRINDTWLQNNMEISIINSQLNKILGILKNGSDKKVSGFGRTNEQQINSDLQNLYGDQWQEAKADLATRGIRIHL